MDKIKGLSIILVSLSAVWELLIALLPSKRFKRIFCIIISCVAILTIFEGIKDISISDFLPSDYENKENYSVATDTEKKIDDYILLAGQEEMAKYITDSLKEKEIFAEKVDVIMDRNKDKSIYIKEISITLNDEQKYLKNAVKIIAENILNNEVKIKVM